MDFFADTDGISNSELKAVMKMASEVVSPSTITRTREASDAPSVQKRWKAADVESLVTSLLAFPGTGKEVSLVRVCFFFIVHVITATGRSFLT